MYAIEILLLSDMSLPTCINYIVHITTIAIKASIPDDCNSTLIIIIFD